MIIRLFPVFFLLILFSSCVEEFQPDLEGSGSRLVVDGRLTDQQGPYTISLSTTAGPDIDQIEPLAGATVAIRQENGPVEVLEEIAPGIYQTDPDGIHGVVGERYRLEMTTGDRRYASSFEMLKAPVPILSVDAKLEYRSTFESPEEVPGIQFYVNTQPSPHEKDYFLWTLEGTYKYHASLLIYYVYDGSLREFENHDTLNTCYRTYDITGIFTAGTSNLSIPQVVNKPLYFLPATDIRLSVRYSLLTTQYSVSREAYEFWHAVEQQSAGSGSLYATQPYQVRGNLVNLDNPDEPVLGYFTVGGVSQNRIFVDPPPEVDIVLADCVPDPMALMFVFDSKPEQWPIYLPGGEGVSLGLVEPECLDCRLSGGKLEIPDFWID